jgi:hypothetical protein
MWMCEVGQNADGQVAASRVAANDDIRRVTTIGFNEIAEELDGLLQLRRVGVLGRQVVRQKEDGDVGAERLLEVVEPDVVAGAAGPDISAACLT